MIIQTSIIQRLDYSDLNLNLKCLCDKHVLVANYHLLDMCSRFVRCLPAAFLLVSLIMTTARKWKRVVLSTDDKVKIIKLLSEKFGVGKSRARDIKKNKENILEFSREMVDMGMRENQRWWS